MSHITFQHHHPQAGIASVTLRSDADIQAASYLDFFRLALSGMSMVARFTLVAPLSMTGRDEVARIRFENQLTQLHNIWVACRADFMTLHPAGDNQQSFAESILVALVEALQNNDHAQAHEAGLQILHPHGLLDFVDVLQRVLDQISYAPIPAPKPDKQNLNQWDFLADLRRQAAVFPKQNAADSLPGYAPARRVVIRYLGNFLDLLFQSACRNIDLAHVSAFKPTTDERRFMNSIACLQAGRVGDALSWLDGWMPRAILLIAHDPLCRLALSLDEAGLQLKEVSPV